MLSVLPSSYTNRLFASIPENYYLIALIGLFVFTFVFITQVGIKAGVKLGLGLFLAEYVFLLLCSTVFFRSGVSDNVNFVPFKTYQEIQNGNNFLLSQSIMNVLVFVPIGLLLRVIQNKWYVALSVGFLISLCVEMLQYLLAKGYCEIDDVIHNTLGCLLGIGIYMLGRRCYLMLR